MRKKTLYLPDELHEALKAEAERSGRREADLVREAVEQFLRSQDRPLPLSVGIGEDTELAARGSEDWLYAQWGRR